MLKGASGVAHVRISVLRVHSAQFTLKVMNDIVLSNHKNELNE